MVNSWFLLFLLSILLSLENFVWIVFSLFQVSSVSSFPSFRAIGVNLAEQRHARGQQPSQPDFCTRLDQNYTVEEIINAKCFRLIAVENTGYPFIMDKNVQVDMDSWNNFTANLRQMIRIHFIFNGSSVTTINFPNLQAVRNSVMKILDNQQLTSINFTASHEMEISIGILDNPILETVTVAAKPNLKALGFRIENNPQLKIIDMDKLTKIDVRHRFTILDNIMLKEIKMGSLTEFKSKYFGLSGNKILEKLVFPKMSNFNVENITSIAKNDKLSKISFSLNSVIFLGDEAEIMQNKKLEVVEFTSNDDFKIANFLRVRGNPNIHQEILEMYNKMKIDKDIQNYTGECIFDEVVKDFAELEDCIIIEGGVDFTSSTTGNITNNRLRRIHGDVYLADLRHEQVNFLSGLAITGKITSDRCDFKLPPLQVISMPCSLTSMTTATTTTTAATTAIIPIEPTMITTSRRSTPSRPLPYSTTPAATRLIPTAKPSKAPPSQIRNTTAKPPASDKSTAEEPPNKMVLIAAAVGVAVFLVVIIIVACLCIWVPAGRGRKDKVKLYQRVFPCFNKSKKSADKSSNESTKSGGSDEKVKNPQSNARRKTKSKAPRHFSSRQSKPSRVSGREPSPPIVEMRTARAHSTLPSVSVRPPTLESDSEKTAPAPSRPMPSAPVGSQRQAVKIPRLSYQHDLLARMEEFLENSENYEISEKDSKSTK